MAHVLRSFWGPHAGWRMCRGYIMFQKTNAINLLLSFRLYWHCRHWNQPWKHIEHIRFYNHLMYVHAFPIELKQVCSDEIRVVCSEQFALACLSSLSQKRFQPHRSAHFSRCWETGFVRAFLGPRSRVSSSSRLIDAQKFLWKHRSHKPFKHSRLTSLCVMTPDQCRTWVIEVAWLSLWILLALWVVFTVLGGGAALCFMDMTPGRGEMRYPWH